MRLTCLKQPARMIAGLLTGLLFVIVAVPLGAQPASESRTGKGFGPVYDAAREVRIEGTVQQVVTKRAVGSPAGMHLLVSRTEGVVDAHVGPFLTKDTQEALHTGLPVQMVGMMQQINGKQYLLVRQLVFGGRTVTVRNEHGFLAHAHSRPRSKPNNRNSRTTQKGESL